MNQKLVVSCVSVGLREHGHNISFSPFAALTVIDAVRRELGESVQCHLFDMAILGIEEVIQRLEQVNTEVLLLSVPVSGYWPMGVRLCEWASNKNIPVLAGGYHFNIEGSPIPRIAAARRQSNVCYGDGKVTAPAFVNHLLDPERTPIKYVPNLYYWNGSQVEKTLPESMDLGTFPYPSPPLEVHDPRHYWRLLAQTPMHHSGMDTVDGSIVGRTLVGPEVLLGCTYRTSRLRSGKKACEYCTITSKFDAVSGSQFWESMRQAYEYAMSIPWTGAPAIRVYQTNDDMGSNKEFIKKVWNSRPGWFIDAMQSDAKIGQRVYAWNVMSNDQARMLRDIGVRWIYIGADGKSGFTPEPSDRHPLVQTLKNCRAYGLSINLGFVLGLENQTWDDLKKWLTFRHWLVKHYADVIAYVNGWVHVVAPGSPSWETLNQIDPQFSQTDCGDDPRFMEKVRDSFFRNCTQLCVAGMTTEKVRTKLYDLALEFELDRGKISQVPHSFMLEP